MIAESAGLCEPDQAIVIIAENIAQHVIGVLTDRGRCHRVHDRRAGIADRKRDIGHPAGLWMRDAGYKLTLPRFRRTDGFADGAYLAARYACRAHPWLPK